jgi:hypothetical protein
MAGPMKRRKFIEALALVPAASAAALAQTPAYPSQTPPGPGTPPPGGGYGQMPPQGQAPPDPVTYAGSEDAATAVVGFFTPAQFAALERVSRLFVPAMQGAPGAGDVGAAQFLDFYVGRSPVERQTLYRTGLDGLNAHAQKRFHRLFGETDDTQADALLTEYLSRPWSYAPSDPIEAFLRTAQNDVRRATQNSRAYAATLATPPTTNWLRQL